MFCPKCGHNQASEDVRFCSRCGFQLAAVSELLANEGITQVQDLKASTAPRFSRFGAKLIFFSIVLFPVILLLSIAWNWPELLFVPAFLLLTGVAQIAYRRIFGENRPSNGHRKNDLEAKTGPGYLPPAAAPSAASLFDRETADFTASPTITEPTTRLLEIETEVRKR